VGEEIGQRKKNRGENKYPRPGEWFLVRSIGVGAIKKGCTVQRS